MDYAPEKAVHDFSIWTSNVARRTPLNRTDATKLTAQIGAGYRRLRPEILVRDDIGGVISRTEQQFPPRTGI